MNNKVKKQRAPNLNEERISAILRIVDAWAEQKLSWAGLVHTIEGQLGAKYTRQALSKHQKIQLAYETKNSLLAQTGGHSRPSRIPSLDEALNVIAAQNSEIARLQKIEERLLEQFARWATNAWLEGIDPRRLDRQLDNVDRDSSRIEDTHEPRKTRKQSPTNTAN